jgi:hypothetical protein
MKKRDYSFYNEFTREQLIDHFHVATSEARIEVEKRVAQVNHVGELRTENADLRSQRDAALLSKRFAVKRAKSAESENHELRKEVKALKRRLAGSKESPCLGCEFEERSLTDGPCNECGLTPDGRMRQPTRGGS